MRHGPAVTSVRNARIVLPDEVLTGGLSLAGGRFTSIDGGAGQAGEDFDGDYLIPGLVELHTDHLESHYRPRPKVFWHPMAALQAHDAQIAASGITTVFDAVRVGSDADSDYNLSDHVPVLLDTISAARRDRRLRAEHFVHIRCELASADALDQFEAHHRDPAVRLASLMDHTPGQRQFVTLDLYYAYYQGKSGRTDAEMENFIAARTADQRQYAARNRAGIIAASHAAGLPLASHDDTTAAHAAEAAADGVKISEFPTTLEAAQAAHAAGLAIIMGAPNVVRGKSHSGNVSALELAEAGLLDILSSDYVPFALIHAAFLLPELVGSISLPQAIARVTRNPARAAGLDDRGEIGIGKKADFVRVAISKGVPIVKAVWRDGNRVG